MKRLALIIVAAGLITAGIPVVAQQMVGRGGQALDSSLRLGSGGYNRSRAYGRRQPYQTLSHDIYRPTSSGTLRYDAHRAFNPRVSYGPRYYPDRQYTNATHRRFRGYGPG